MSPSTLRRIALALALAMGLAPSSLAGSRALPQSADSGPGGIASPPQDAGDKKAPKKPKVEKAEPEGWHREGLALKNGKSRVEITGYAQEDFRHYDWTVKGDESGAQQASEHELRRLRIGAKARLGGFYMELAGDPRTSQKGSRLKDATVGYEFSKKFSVLLGHFKPPVSREFLTASAKTDFVDRAMIASRLTPDRDWGVALSGQLGDVEYAGGIFRGDGDSNPRNAGTSGAARASVHLFKGFQVSGSFMQGEVHADPRVGTAEPLPKGASAVTASGFIFWNRPHVEGTRRRLGGDASYSRGPFRIQAEYLELKEERRGQGSTGQDVPDVLGRGWSAQASYVVAGDRKGSTVDPRKSLFRGGVGALEIVARVEALKFDDTGDPSGFAGFGNRARNISPSGASAVEAGLNYWASRFLRFQGCALWESYNDPLIAPEPGNKGRYFTLLGRVQVMIP